LSVGGEAPEPKHRAESAATTIALAAQPISDAPSATPAAALPPKRPPISRAEREAIRQRRHLILALSGAVILLIAAYILFTVSGGSSAID
jgi:hypothetical protein